MAGSNAPVGDESSLPIADDDFSSGGTAIRIASVAALGGLLFGYDSAVINGAVDSIQEDFGIGNAELGFAVASALLGAATGAMTAGWIADKIGRISVMKIAAVLFLVSAIGTGFAHDVWTVVLFRIVGGIGVGVASVIAPAYIAETSPPRIRGRLGSLQQLAIVLGIFASFAVNWLLQWAAGGPNEPLWFGLDAWRWMFLVMALPAILYGVLAFTIPESPRYLVASHKIPEARRVLTMLLGEKNLEITITRIQETLEREDKPSLRDLKKPTGGIYGIVWVGPRAVDLPAVRRHQRDLLLLERAVAGGRVQRRRVGRLHRDHLGHQRADDTDRHRADRQDRAQAAAAHRIVGHGGHAHHDVRHLRERDTGRREAEPPGASGVIALVAANLFVVAFGMSWGPVVWVLLGEMFPNRIRAAALGIAAAGQWAANWVITVTFPGLREHLGMAYGFYGLCAVLSGVFVWRWVMETKGVSLEDMHGEILHQAAPKAST